MSVRHHLGLRAHIFPLPAVLVRHARLVCQEYLFVNTIYALGIVVNRIVVEGSKEA